MSQTPLMPKATAVWLVDNTALSFRQIADFCHLHELEVKGIADGEVAQGIKGLDPISSNQLTREEIEKAEKDPGYRLKMAERKVKLPPVKAKKGPRYTPVSRRQDRPDAIAWLVRYHPELSDGQIIKLIGTTKTTIAAIRDRTHWNSSNIKPVDPVTLGLSSQLDLDFAVQKAAKKAGIVPVAPENSGEGTIRPVDEVLARMTETAPAAAHGQSTAENTFSEMPDSEHVAVTAEEEQFDADSVFAKLKDMKTSDQTTTEE